MVQLSTVLVPPLRPVFRTTAELGMNGWVFIVGMAALVVPAAELYKVLVRLLSPKVTET
jgi:hypothetical protein